MKAIDLIRNERERQINTEGWTPEHDDEHENGELAYAAACYAAPEEIYLHRDAEISFFINSGDRGDREPLPERHISAWPWDEEWDKRDKHDRLRQLVIAGALIAAEIDRRLRLAAQQEAER